ncbi:hypothetical protein GGF43_004025, partial [Coemansia sp. RSA 2618]
QESGRGGVDDADGISIRRLLSGILARPALAEQMLDDVAQLVWATRSARARMDKFM